MCEMTLSAVAMSVYTICICISVCVCVLWFAKVSGMFRPELI